MAKRDGEGSKNGEKVSRESGKVADIHTAAKSLIGEDYSRGYGTIMKEHINKGASKGARKGAAD